MAVTRNLVPAFDHLSLGDDTPTRRPQTPPALVDHYPLAPPGLKLRKPVDFRPIGPLTPPDDAVETKAANKLPVIEHDPDITIFYDSGREKMKVHKQVLCSQSAWFRNALEGYFKENGTTVLRLRNDHPLAISAMENYLYTSTYPSYPTIRATLHERWPRTTDLDYHILVYSVADKYDVPGLRTLATKNYISLVEEIMKMDLRSLFEAQDAVAVSGPGHNGASDFSSASSANDDKTSTTAVMSEPVLPFEEVDRGMEAQFYRFINSLTLIYAKTPSRKDELRGAVLEVIKGCILNLMWCREFIMMLMGDAEFYSDLEESLEEDGLRVWVERRGDEKFHVGLC